MKSKEETKLFCPEEIQLLKEGSITSKLLGRKVRHRQPIRESSLYRHMSYYCLFLTDTSSNISELNR